MVILKRIKQGLGRYGNHFTIYYRLDSLGGRQARKQRLSPNDHIPRKSKMFGYIVSIFVVKYPGDAVSHKIKCPALTAWWLNNLIFMVDTLL